MESSRDLSSEEREKYFELDLKKADLDVQDRYYSLLLSEKIRRRKESRGKSPDEVPLEERESFLSIARNTPDIETAKKSLKMSQDWERATSKKGRPPIGGAQDD